MRAIQRFGKQLQRLRTRRGLTQEQLAVTAGLSRTFLTRLELGQHDPLLSTLVRLAKALPVDEFFAASLTVSNTDGDKKPTRRSMCRSCSRDLCVGRYRDRFPLEAP